MLLNLHNIKTNKKNFILCYVLIFIFLFVLSYHSYNVKKKHFFLLPRRFHRNSGANNDKCLILFQKKCTCKEIDDKYDVIVIGGGHSGCEAGHISAKMNAKTLLITQNKNTIGEMSCNPSIGGIGKGILVKEIDALGGLMGKVIDKSGIHFKILNLKKGLAVRGHRAQADRNLYNYYMKQFIFNTPHLYILENIKKKIYGIKNKCGCEFYANSVILTTGTFLGGICHIGKEKIEGVEKSNNNLATQLIENGFEIKRMKTGTPPRLDLNSINFDILEKEDSEKKYPFYFSFLNSNKINNNKTIPCYKTFTNTKTHELVIKHLKELPDFDSYDKLGNGPRYCPSIAKKVTKFSEKNQHTIWLEPEGINSNLIYPNGLSSAYPLHIQQKIINSIRGLEQAQIVSPAYDVEYYYVNPRCLKYTLETKNVDGLFFAGQICGTTGYEEAACQGIVAGINAASNNKINHDGVLKNTKNFILKRTNSYIGVLIHDLINKGVSEPYRIFTSRAEYRLYLRPDNCDIRLTPKAHQLGIVSDERMYLLKQKYSTVNKLIYVFKNLRFNEMQNGSLKNTQTTMSVDPVTPIKETTTTTGLLDSQSNLHFQQNSYKKNMNTLYNTLKSGREYDLDVLLQEIKKIEKLNKYKPTTLYDANKLEGVTMSAIYYLYHYVKNNKHKIKKMEHT
uniref:MnmG N-terminal domain-containing protein n=1 Tax=Piliocolobus tephrosceles TaxID=591936 RepID=A0A8C9H166_9PRIM